MTTRRALSALTLVALIASALVALPARSQPVTVALRGVLPPAALEVEPEATAPEATALEAKAPGAGADALEAVGAPEAEGETEVVATEGEDEAPRHDPLGRTMAGGHVVTGFTRHRMLHFTFDDGPRLETTPQLLDHLDHYGVHATFFLVTRDLVGPRSRRKVALAREIARRGHTVGAHSHVHGHLTAMEAPALEADLVASEAAFTSALGGRPWLYRPPYGARNDAVDAALVRHGYTQVLWNTTAGTIRTRSAEEMVASFRQALRRRERHPRGPGGVMIMHDTHQWAVDAFPQIMEVLRERNCELLSQEGEELWDVTEDLSLFVVPQDRRAELSVHVPDAVVAARQARVRAEATRYCAERARAAREIAAEGAPATAAETAGAAEAQAAEAATAPAEGDAAPAATVEAEAGEEG